MQALTYSFEVCTTVSTLTLILAVLELLTRSPDGIAHALEAATVQLAAKAMRSYPAIEHLQVPGLKLLANISTENEEGLDAVISAGSNVK
jgi:hypothetical protein